MRLLVTGSAGQLGWELQRLVKDLPPTALQSALWTDVAELDIADSQAVARTFAEFKPTVVVNAAAYTAVDKAETEHVIAFKINRDGAGILAQAARLHNARFLHVSTDFVFDGQGKPYELNDEARPLSVYGASKHEGEQLVLAAGGQSLIVRTAWVYSSHGGNFVKTMLRLMADKPSLNVVTDQVGSPTWAKGLAQTLLAYAQLASMPTGMAHYTDSGVASWYDFAVAIQEEALVLGLLHKPVPISPIPASHYPTAAQRPGFSVLNKSSSISAFGAAPHWRVQLRAMLRELL